MSYDTLTARRSAELRHDKTQNVHSSQKLPECAEGSLSRRSLCVINTPLEAVAPH